MVMFFYFQLFGVLMGFLFFYIGLSQDFDAIVLFFFCLVLLCACLMCIKTEYVKQLFREV